MGEWDYDPLTGEWVELGSPTVAPPVLQLPPPRPLPDPGANHGLPGQPACDPNSLYPAGHRCNLVQQYRDAREVVRIVQTAAGKPPAGGVTAAGGDITQQLNAFGANAAAWVSQNSMLVTAGVLALLVFGTVTGRGRGGR